jgi:hypothetical protein
MAWPNSARATGYVVTAADWNEVAAALALWGGNVDADGNDLENVSTIVCGSGDGETTAADGEIRGPLRSGTDAIAPNLVISAGVGTGQSTFGNADGAILFKTQIRSSGSSSTPNPTATRLKIQANGAILIGCEDSGDASQPNTSFPLSAHSRGTSSYLTITSTPLDGSNYYCDAGLSFSYRLSPSSGPLGGMYNLIAYKTGSSQADSSDRGLYIMDTQTYDVRFEIFGDGGITIGSPTGGSQGAGTINAVGVYDDGVLLTCYVPELKQAGGDVSQIDLAKWDARVPDRVIPAKRDRTTGAVIEPERTETRIHEPLRDFLANRADTIDARVYAQRWKTTGVLPGFPSPQEWADNGPLSTGQLLQKLWEHIELQAVHIDQLATEIDALRN